jgi:hypothetical protein
MIHTVSDVPGSEIVLVSCGAPVVNGLSFPSDDLAAEAIEESASANGISATKHVRTVYVHAWSSERVIRLTWATWPRLANTALTLRAANRVALNATTSGTARTKQPSAC